MSCASVLRAGSCICLRRAGAVSSRGKTPSTMLLRLVWLLGIFVAARAVAADRPNILWITAEDMSPNLGCYGDSFARTPHVDAFAREAVRYTRAFAAAPVCSP